MKNRTAAWALLALLTLAPAAPATTYYVRATGSNANPGTSPDQAWATLAYAATQVNAGDVVYVGAGTYTDQVSPTRDGTSASPIWFIADTHGIRTGDAGTVLLRRSGTVLNITNDDYLTFTGFSIESTSSSGSVVLCSNSTALILERCTVEGGDEGYYQPSGGSTIIRDCTIENVGEFAVWADGGTLTIEDSVLRGHDSYYGVRIGYSGSSDVTMRRTRILNGDYGVRIGNGTATLVDCIIADDNMTTGIRVEPAGDGLTVINCTFYGMNGDGINFAGGTTTIRNTIFLKIGDDCMDMDGGSITASHNLVWDYGSDRSEGFDSSEIRQNPDLADPAGGDFSLEAGSPAIDAGWDASGFTATDIAGGARPTGAGYDIGAHEFGSGVTPADVPYATDFSTIGDEWENAIAASDGDVGDYIGRYGRTGGAQTSTTLHLNTTAGYTYTLIFDLLTIDSWDANHATWGPDAFRVLQDGAEIFRETFSHAISPTEQSYPAPASSTGSWMWAGNFVDGRYDGITVTFVANGGVTELTFIGDATEDITNESWGLLDVEVTATPPVFVDISDETNFEVDTDAGIHDGSGLSWADFDNDGDLDAFMTGARAYLLRQNGSTGVFTAYFLGDFSRGAAVLDAEGDGDPDVFNGDTYHMTVFENLGGLLVDRGDCGVNGPSNVEHAVAMDVDADGACDLVIPGENGNWIALNRGAGFSGYNPVGFEDAKNSADGMNDAGDAGNGDYAATADVNNDGRLDLFVRYGTGKLFVSDGDGTFTEGALGISVHVNNDDKAGSAFGDYDNDGDMDLFAADARHGHAGTLWRNASAGVAFTNVASSAGVTSTAIQRSATWGDYDNDGDLDLYITTSSAQPNALYTNNGDGTFTLNDLGAGLTGDFQDAVFVDVDNDGDLDLALTRIDGDGRTVLLENQTNNDAYLKVRLIGTGNVNTLAIGARVELLDGAGTTLLGTREIGTARGFGGIEPLWAHFGGVDPAATYTLRVVWPGGDEQTVAVVPQNASTTIGSTTIDQMITIESDTGGARFVRWREVDPTE